MELYQQLEHELVKWSGTGGLYSPDQIVACSSGTAALHLALEALGLPAGSEVLVPDYTMVACARAVTLAGLVPVFVDCDDRLLMSWFYAGSAIAKSGDKVRAVLPVHVYGRRLETPEDAFRRYGVRVIEDMAESHGVPPHSDTDAACWSFYKNKIIAGEEGGAVAFKNPTHASIARELRSLGDQAGDPVRTFVHRPRGHNYRLANCLAEKVLDSLRVSGGKYVKVDGSTRRQYSLTPVGMRREAEGWYDEVCPAEWKMPPRDAPWVYDVRIPGLRRVKMWKVVSALNRAGVEARCGFVPMSMQPEYCSETGHEVAGYNPDGRGYNSWQAFDEVFYLPLTPGTVTRESVKKSFEVIQEVFGEG